MRAFEPSDVDRRSFVGAERMPDAFVWHASADRELLPADGHGFADVPLPAAELTNAA